MTERSPLLPTALPLAALPDFGQSALQVAPQLLGAVLDCGGVTGHVVEVEAYTEDDPASHSFRGPTNRTQAMFGPPGHLYVYQIYGVHYCANVVCGPAGTGEAVLIRALRPLDGISAMQMRRPAAKAATDLCSGPGKLTAALAIGREHDGVDLLAESSAVRLLPPSSHDPVDPVGPVGSDSVGSDSGVDVRCGPRVGITKAVDRPWRFAVANEPNVSRPVPKMTWTPHGGRAASQPMVPRPDRGSGTPRP